MDFCASEEVEESAYDVITCLSTVKWIHLHHGDEGILYWMMNWFVFSNFFFLGVKRLFRKVYKALRSGGRFILEPQPWQSYRKKRWLSPEVTSFFIDTISVKSFFGRSKQHFKALSSNPYNSKSFYWMKLDSHLARLLGLLMMVVSLVLLKAVRETSKCILNDLFRKVN